MNSKEKRITIMKSNEVAGAVGDMWGDIMIGEHGVSLSDVMSETKKIENVIYEATRKLLEK